MEFVIDLVIKLFQQEQDARRVDGPSIDVGVTELDLAIEKPLSKD